MTGREIENSWSLRRRHEEEPADIVIKEKFNFREYSGVIAIEAGNSIISDGEVY